MDYNSRQKQFAAGIAEHHLDGFIVTHPPNLRYLCGYTGSNGLLLFLGSRPVFFTDGRYTQQAREEVRGARVIMAKGPLLESAGQIIGKLKSAAIGFEADHTTVAAARDLRNIAHKKVAWKPTAGLVMRQRLVKDAAELRIIRAAVKLGAEVYQKALRSVRPGIAEATVAGRLELAAREGGADGMSFETIVAAARRSALPHGRATRSSIPRRGFVVIDSGVVIDGYCSDMTRTVHVGRANPQVRSWYSAVLDAQLAGIAAVRAGAAAGEVDRAARNVLRKHKLDRYFTHSTGHGVGLEIHEPPRLGRDQPEPLQAGMVITIEPGIYVPGRGGVRIEDMVVVTDGGCEVLTPVTKELIEI